MLSVSCPVKFLQTIESAHKKGTGSTKNHSPSPPLVRGSGVKIYVDQAKFKIYESYCLPAGTKIHPGKNVGLGRDHSIFALINGLVDFEKFGPDKKKVSVNLREVQPELPK